MNRVVNDSEQLLSWKSATLIILIVVFHFEQIADPFGTDNSDHNLLDFSKIRGIEIGIRIDSALMRKHMAHNHGNEYQIRIIFEDGTEELSGWMNSADQVAQAMIAVHKPQGRTCWLRVRNITCLNCSDLEQVLEYPIMDIAFPRYIPHDSRYLQVAGSRNRYALGFSSLRHTS